MKNKGLTKTIFSPKQGLDLANYFKTKANNINIDFQTSALKTITTKSEALEALDKICTNLSSREYDRFTSTLTKLNK